MPPNQSFHIQRTSRTSGTRTKITPSSLRDTHWSSSITETGIIGMMHEMQSMLAKRIYAYVRYVAANPSNPFLSAPVSEPAAQRSAHVE